MKKYALLDQIISHQGRHFCIYGYRIYIIDIYLRAIDGVFILVVGVGRDLSPHYWTYLADCNRWCMADDSDDHITAIN